MSSLFSRARTKSTPKTPQKLGLGVDGYDEFGRAPSRQSVNDSTPTKKGKKKNKDGTPGGSSTNGKHSTNTKAGRSLDRQHYQSEFGEQFGDLYDIPDGSFLVLNLDPPRGAGEGDNSSSGNKAKEHDYGYLSYQRHVVLGLDELARLVDVVAGELGSRGLTTPFIFSTIALDVSANAIRRLIRAFLQTCSTPSPQSDLAWREEARLAGPHELGMCLRWGLARAVRVVGGQDYRGLIAWEHYVEFRNSEAELRYPPHHFETFLAPLVPLLQNIVTTLLSLLMRFTAHSASSGHTPPTLSPLFGPLMFGLGPATLSFHHTYHHYLRATNAMEHILLAYIRWQDVPPSSPTGDPSGSSHIATNGSNSSSTSLGLPTRLKDWIRGYPAMLPGLLESTTGRSGSARQQPRTGARTVRVISIKRNVRMYSPDLVRTAAGWASARPYPPARALGAAHGVLAMSKEWERIAPPQLRLPPRYSDAYKKRMDMPGNCFPDTGVPLPGTLSSAPSTISSVSSTSTLLDDDRSDDRFRSLTDLKWGEFEELGFGGLREDKLQFDLTESARSARHAKRATLTWNDFSAAGFSRTDDPLKMTLQFSMPVEATISAWPTKDVEITRKLKKTQRALPAFGWDTDPVLGGEEIIEEAFVDVFCDLVYGGGWMDLERDEELDRECNWALVEYRSLPVSSPTNETFSSSDPRTSTTLVLYEEFVPLEYRQQLALKNAPRSRIPSIFSTSSRPKAWKQATTLNGRPYVPGQVPLSPSHREVEFEGLLYGNSGATKVISSSGVPQTTVINATPSVTAASASVMTPTKPARPAIPGLPVNSNLGTTTPFLPTPPASSFPASPGGGAGTGPDADRSESPRRLGARFRLASVASPVRRSGLPAAEYSTVEFETREARVGHTDDEDEDGLSPSKKKKKGGSGGQDDAWVDILVATQGRKIDGQAAEMRTGPRMPRGIDPSLSGGGGGGGGAYGRADEVPEVVRESTPPPLPSSLYVDELDAEPVLDSRTASIADRDSSYFEDGSGESPADGGDTENDSEVSYPRPQQRRAGMGYFDLHPERRLQARQPHLAGADPRMADGMSELDEPRRPFADDESVTRDSMDSSAREDLEEHIPYPHKYGNGIDTGALAPAPARRSDALVPPLQPKLRVLPTPPVPAPAPAAPAEPPKPSGSKTASLIEMYRQREQQSAQGSSSKVIPAPLVIPRGPLPKPLQQQQPPVNASSSSSSSSQPVVPASRLPVRSDSMPKAPSPVSDISISTSPTDLYDEESLPEHLMMPGMGSSGLDSPRRYVHGAPLHNVIEEPEEEE